MATQLVAPRKSTLIETFADRHGLDASKVLGMLSATAFNQGKEPPLSAEELQAALIICNTYDLNPMLREIFVFRSKGKLLVYVPVDGWTTIINRQETLDGVEFEEHFTEDNRIHAVTCRIHRKDRSIPTTVTEYTHECKRDTEPWNKMPIRMTRNRAFIQCARVAFSISGIVDEDEAATIEGHPGPVIEGRAYTIEQSQEAEALVNELGWTQSRRDSFAKQYAARPTEGLAYLRKEVEKLKRVTPKKQTPEPSPANTQQPEATSEPAPVASEDQTEEKPSSEVEW